MSASLPPSPRMTIAVTPSSGQTAPGQPGPAAAPANVTFPPPWVTDTASFVPSPANVITPALEDTVPAAATPGAASTSASARTTRLSTASPSCGPRGTCA